MSLLRAELYASTLVPTMLESPFAGATQSDITRNLCYARACMIDMLSRGEAPLPSHLLYPQVLDDEEPEGRAQGIGAGLAWASIARAAAFYTDLDWSPGMHAAQEFYRRQNITTVWRHLPNFDHWIATYNGTDA